VAAGVRLVLVLVVSSSLQDASQQIAEQNCLFCNRQINTDLLVRQFGQQSHNRTPFCSASVLASQQGDPCMCASVYPPERISPDELNDCNPTPMEDPRDRSHLCTTQACLCQLMHARSLKFPWTLVQGTTQDEQTLTTVHPMSPF